MDENFENVREAAKRLQDYIRSKKEPPKAPLGPPCSDEDLETVVEFVLKQP